MSKRIFHLVFIISLLIPFISHADIPQYENKRIAKISIEPENLPSGATFDSTPLLKQMKTKVGDRFSQLTFDSDLKTLAIDYEHVDPNLSLQNNEVYITIKVQPRPIISSILWKGDFKTKKRKLQQELNIFPQTAFDKQKFNKAFHRLKEYYVKRGYFEAQLEYKVIPKTQNQVVIEIHINEGRSGKINKIIFKGLNKKEESEILDKIHTKKFSIFRSWYQGTGIFREEAIEYDKMTILRILQNEGYADASVEIRIEEAKKSNRINVVIIADKGNRYYFGDVTFKGNKHFSDETISQLILVKKGEPYSPDKLQQSVSNITGFYGQKGYIDASVTYQPVLQEDEPIYSIHFSISEGSIYRVGKIKVLGNKSTQTKVILHESLLVPGEVFNTNKLQHTETRLENIGYFKKTVVYPTPVEDTSSIGAPLRDVNIEVEETNTGNFGLFFGFSSLEKIFGGGEIVEKNFNIAGLPYVFSEGIHKLRGGGEYLKIKGSVGQKLNDYLLSWTKPYFLDSNWTIGFQVNQNTSRLQAKEYNIDSFSALANAFYHINAYLNFECHYRFRNTNLHVNSGASPSIIEESRNRGIISAVGFGLFYNSTNNPFKATRGFISDLEAEFSGVGGKFTFFKFQYNNSYYQPLLPRVISKTRADFNFIIPVGAITPDTVPVGERYFLGGNTTVRGYRGFSIGPKYDNSDPKGGISSVLLSEEILLEVMPTVDLFGFFDAGSLSLERFNVDIFRASAGFGVRIIILNRIPFIFGYGVPLNPETRRDVHRSFFSLGGKF